MKNYLYAGLGVLALVGILALLKVLQMSGMIHQMTAMKMPPTVISASPVEEQDWEMTLQSVGSLESVQGVTVTADLPGRVTKILFQGGANVKAGDVLLLQDTSSEETQLRAAEANASLAKVNLDRIEELYKKKVASKSEFDSAEASYKAAVAQADTYRTAIAKKTVKAPFDGRLGIRQVNVGQDLGTGDPIASLQYVNSIYVNFSLPQQDMSKLKLGLPVRLSTDAVPNEVFNGEITAVNPEVDPTTRNIRVQATVKNEDLRLLPGMFGHVEVVLPETRHVMAVPQTAVAYATFGDSVFVVVDEKNKDSGESEKIARQQFVRLGLKRGDFVEIEAGVKTGDMVVNAGVFKLRNGAPVAINDKPMPDYKLNPNPADS